MVSSLRRTFINHLMLASILTCFLKQQYCDSKTQTKWRGDRWKRSLKADLQLSVDMIRQSAIKKWALGSRTIFYSLFDIVRTQIKNDRSYGIIVSTLYCRLNYQSDTLVAKSWSESLWNGFVHMVLIKNTK